MKEYEYIVEAIDGYLCDELTSVIASENYRNRTYKHGYRKIFMQYCELHEEFQAERERFMDPVQEREAKQDFQRQCQEKREDIQIRFLKDIQACTSIDMKHYMIDYLKKLKDEEVETVAKRICVYPYLVSILRKSQSEGEKSNDSKV